MKGRTMRIYQIKGIISSVLILAGILVYATGAVLFFVKTGMWMGISRKSFNDIHMVVAIIMGAIICIHLMLNKKTYKKEMATLLTKGENNGEAEEDEKLFK